MWVLQATAVLRMPTVHILKSWPLSPTEHIIIDVLGLLDKFHGRQPLSRRQHGMDRPLSRQRGSLLRLRLAVVRPSEPHQRQSAFCNLFREPVASSSHRSRVHCCGGAPRSNKLKKSNPAEWSQRMRTVLSISCTQIVLAVILNCSKPVAPMYSKEETMELTQSQSCLLQDTGGLTTIEYTNRAKRRSPPSICCGR